LHAVAVALTERRLELRPMLYVAIGLTLGMLVNPYFPYNLIFAFRHMLPKLVDATSTQVGSEWFPYTTEQLLKNSLPALLGMVSGIFALGFAGRRMDLRTTFGLLVSLLFALMLFQARRFIEYFPPFALIFACFAWSPLLEALPTGDRRSIFLSRLPAALLLVAVLAAGVFSLRAAGKSMQSSKPANLYAGASAWLAANTPQGERVFQTDWDDFPRLFFYNTHNTYLIGLDPTYMQLEDPKLYDLWLKVTQGKVANISEVVKEKFGARFIHTDLNHGNFLSNAQADTGLEKVYQDGQAVIYMVIK
jgi:hypothetical protein